ncbi:MULTISPECIES: S41 family peptidase [Duncaniella]|jgi:carboxyl-terminal processing protease|uniref:S41 family peptidase n=1 Tax=Duncaniella TaxID=2518495 RepID=UPI000AEFD5D7|nr:MULTISPECIES: S41 family peptidase [Duncaniella]ROS93534.1 S41 family peptidase [Muribaculaceae bacterium Isolate-077 (Janvier)]ROS96639.1 S41 family peptidase [Muribaculaceae bacterium Isolate-084 (Janvier)]ROS96908.1 S41 family peptidase [Muribaculaceae bacterium Isolate-083 (Janvier)]QCD38998.1 S41 family peptidase [Duncaniella sp. C9]QCP72688.1 S41 family peptidase [Duncaniella sp. B8]
MNNRLKKTSVWMPLAIAVALVAGMWIGKSFFNNSARWNSRSKLDTILEIIDRSYVDDVDPDSLLEASFAGLLSHLDPHSVYIPAADLQNVNEELSGSFSGIGISFNLLNDSINVLEVISGGPSEKAGLLAGDKIVSINDTIVAGQKWSDVKVRSSLRGPKGSVVKLGIKRHTSKKILPFEVVRGDIPVTSIDAAYMIAPKTGYVKINKFGSNTYSEFLTSVVNLMADGAEKFVIDLRGNGGGFMEPAVLMANEFLPAGSPIVSMRGKTAPDDRPTFSDGSGSLLNTELVVLIDEVSASASEIFAGAIQDNDRGLVIGRRSFGKGLVQNQIELPDSSALRLTIARYYTPSGRCIQKAYAPGTDYDRDIINRYEHGEFYSADSIKLDKSLAFETMHGRTVYGGGGIMPDIFVPNDTAGITSYYLNVVNAGLIQKYTFDYTDRNRDRLEKSGDVAALLRMLPDDDTLLQDFVSYSQKAGVAPRWYYINISRDLLVNQLKAMIVRNVLGVEGYFKVFNELDPTVVSGVEALASGKAAFPVKETRY